MTTGILKLVMLVAGEQSEFVLHPDERGYFTSTNNAKAATSTNSGKTFDVLFVVGSKSTNFNTTKKFYALTQSVNKATPDTVQLLYYPNSEALNANNGVILFDTSELNLVVRDWMLNDNAQLFEDELGERERDIQLKVFCNIRA